MEITVRQFPRFNSQLETRISNDKFDQSLSRINSVKSFTNFCDSIYGAKQIAVKDSGVYANLVNRVILYRFQHGYTWYHFGHNYLAKLIAPMLNKNLSSIVVPDDILKYPLAACSQQSIVGMKVLMDKGFDVRRVGFYDPKFGGHFCYEVNYANSWHFYDPNREPDEEVLDKYNRPGIQYLSEHPDVLVAAYPRDDSSFVVSLYQTYKTGGEGTLPGRNARLFQQLTKFLSYTVWIFLGLLYFYIDKRFFVKKEK